MRHLRAQLLAFRWTENLLMADAVKSGSAKAQALVDHFGRWVEFETGMLTGLSIRRKSKTKEQMNIHQAETILLKNGFQVCYVSRLSNELGSTIKLSNGSLVVVYDSGKWAVQGKNQAPAFQVLESYAPRKTPLKRPPSKKTISRYKLGKLVRVFKPTKRGDSK